MFRAYVVVESDCPWGDVPSGGIAAIALESFGEDWRVHVVVHVDLTLSDHDVGPTIDVLKHSNSSVDSTRMSALSKSGDLWRSRSLKSRA